MVSIAIDAMGGDHGPSVTVAAALWALSTRQDLKITLVGKENELKSSLSSNLSNYPNLDTSRIQIYNATEVVAMDEPPAVALRRKKDSSMRVALNLVKDSVVDACVSAGNTGALMATARFVLKMIEGVDRPAIMFPLPSMRGPVNILDLGANVDCQAEHLYQFAVMGNILAKSMDNKLNPKVGLLNVGSESIKGTEAVKRAASMLDKEHPNNMNYIGYIEGDDIYKGTADVIVCDGFAGNVVLKASEGLAAMIIDRAKKEFRKNFLTKLISVFAKPTLKSLFNYFDPNSYNGASLLGLQGVVIKSHGKANQQAFAEAIFSAYREVKREVPKQIASTVAQHLGNKYQQQHSEEIL